MSKFQCTRRIQFCSGHRVHKHESKCANLHGHNYVALITAEAEDLDGIGRVVDFSVLKERYGDWIDANWDHGMILNKEDLVTREAIAQLHQKTFIMDVNPTAENMAKLLLDMGPQLMYMTGVVITKVVLWETENCYAEVTNG